MKRRGREDSKWNLMREGHGEVAMAEAELGRCNHQSEGMVKRQNLETEPTRLEGMVKKQRQKSEDRIYHSDGMVKRQSHKSEDRTNQSEGHGQKTEAGVSRWSLTE